MVGLSGLEPPTSRLSGVRSDLLSYKPLFFRRRPRPLFLTLGGDEENRTPDPLLARQVLSQLSYAPKSGFTIFRHILLTASRIYQNAVM